ncbi:MAG: hypothetical protein ACI4F3_11155 [Enterocloster sp.]
MRKEEALTEKVYGKIHRVIFERRKPLACIVLGILLGAASQFASGFDQTLEQGYILERNACGQGQAVRQLLVNGLGEKEIPVEVVLEERSYTQEEAHEIYEAVLEELPLRILGGNESLSEVRSDLNLVTSADPFGVRLKWQSEEPELLESTGRVHGEYLEEAGKKVGLRVRMTDGNWPEEFVIQVQIRPPLLSEEEQKVRQLLREIRDQEEQNRFETKLALPLTFQGSSLTYRIPAQQTFWPLVFLGIAAALLVSLKEKQDVRKKEKLRRQQLLLDYSEVLSRLIIFLGAGMSIRSAWEKIAADYRRAREQGRRPERFVYEEMCVTGSQMKSGVSEQRAFAEFGRRCGLQQYMKLSALLEQSRKNGSRHLRENLKLEMAEAFEQRKHQARRMGEEAGTKLLVPLFMMLSVVMVIIAVPALLNTVNL